MLGVARAGPVRSSSSDSQRRDGSSSPAPASAGSEVAASLRRLTTAREREPRHEAMLQPRQNVVLHAAATVLRFHLTAADASLPPHACALNVMTLVIISVPQHRSSSPESQGFEFWQCTSQKKWLMPGL